MPGGIRLYFGSVNIDIAQFNQVQFFAYQQYIFKPTTDFTYEAFTENGYRIVIGMLVAGNESKGN
jgi:hypothetical protein